MSEPASPPATPSPDDLAAVEQRDQRKLLTSVQTDVLVQRYWREMARYEEVARRVEEQLRRELRRNGVLTLLSSRAKHPEELRDKLLKKRAAPRYAFDALDRNLNDVVTDLAGCRVLVYRNKDIERVATIVRHALHRADMPGSDEDHKKASGYRAVHILVALGDNEERLSLRKALCEVQITSLAAHIFNELEHDITYKGRNVTPSAEEKDALTRLLQATSMVDPIADELLGLRENRVSKIEDAQTLRYLLERAAGRPLRGDFDDLFSLLGAVIARLTIASLTRQASINDLIAQGERRVADMARPAADDVVHLLLGLLDAQPDDAEELGRIVREPSEQTTPLRQIVARAMEEGRSRS